MISLNYSRLPAPHAPNWRRSCWIGSVTLQFFSHKFIIMTVKIIFRIRSNDRTSGRLFVFHREEQRRWCDAGNLLAQKAKNKSSILINLFDKILPSHRPASACWSACWLLAPRRSRNWKLFIRLSKREFCSPNWSLTAPKRRIRALKRRPWLRSQSFASSTLMRTWAFAAPLWLRYDLVMNNDLDIKTKTLWRL